VTGADDCLALSGAEATLSGENDSVYLFWNSSLTLSGSHDALYADADVGNLAVAGFASSDMLHLSAASWTNFAALLSSGDMAQTGPDTTIKLDASHTLTLKGATEANLTAAQFAFG
jgi:hypothetical protein